MNSLTGRVSDLTTPEAWGGVLPIAPTTRAGVPAGTNATSRTFAPAPVPGPAADPVRRSGRLAVLANVGTLIQPTTKAQYQAKSVPLPPNLFSHNDQQSTWQARRHRRGARPAGAGGSAT